MNLKEFKTEVYKVSKTKDDNKKISFENVNRLNQLDGLKGLAVLIIIASHTSAFGMYGQGSIWADFFFVLSGFFCALPFVKPGKENIASIGGTVSFYVKKIARIMPTYWFCILFFSWLKDNLFNNKRAILRSMLLIQTSGHNWYVQHLMVGFLFVPVVFFIIKILKKININDYVIATVLLLCSIFLCKWLFWKSDLYLLWNNGNHRVIFSGLVILGLSVGYLYKTININFKKYMYFIMDFIEIALILTLSIFTANSFLIRFNEKYIDYIFGWNHPDICGYISALLILIAALNKNGIMNRIIGNAFLVFLGKISLEIYLVHFYLLDYFNLSNNKKYILILFITIPIGCFLYKYFGNKIYEFVKKLLKKGAVALDN